MARDVQGPADDAGPTADDGTDLETLPTTDSGAIRKKDAMEWLGQLDRPTDDELIAAVNPRAYDAEGSSYPTATSGIRLTGDAEFVETAAGLLVPLLAWESSATRIGISLSETEDRETGETTGNYALHIKAVERGDQGQMREALLGGNRENDERLLEAFENADE